MPYIYLVHYWQFYFTICRFHFWIICVTFRCSFLCMITFVTTLWTCPTKNTKCHPADGLPLPRGTWTPWVSVCWRPQISWWRDLRRKWPRAKLTRICYHRKREKSWKDTLCKNEMFSSFLHCTAIVFRISTINFEKKVWCFDCFHDWFIRVPF